MAEYTRDLDNKKVHLIGTLKSRTWRDVVTLQFQVVDLLKE